MRITICGSISFMDKMEELVSTLKIQGFNEIYRPIGVGGKQHVLGWLIIFLPRHIQGSLVKLSDEELQNYKIIFYDESAPTKRTFKNEIGKAL